MEYFPSNKEMAGEIKLVQSAFEDALFDVGVIISDLRSKEHKDSLQKMIDNIDRDLETLTRILSELQSCDSPKNP